MATRSLDKDTLNQGLLLSLPFSEGTGTVLTQDVAKPHHPVLQTHAPAWTQLPSGLYVMTFDGVSDYLSCAGASCTDLDFIAGDFTLVGWTYVEDMAAAHAWMGRFVLDASGWETFFFNYLLTLRISTGGADPSVSCYGEGYDPDVWMLVGISRAGAYPLFFRDGQVMTAGYEAGGIPNPTSSAADMMLANNPSNNYLPGKLWNPRIWNRALTSTEHRQIFHRERHLFGV